MKTLRLHFCDFSSDFSPKDDFFYQLLAAEYDVILDPAIPQFVVYSCYGYDFLEYDCPRIFYTAENIRPDFNLCDYAIGFDYLDFGDRYMRFPNFARYGRQFEDLTRLAPLTAQDIQQKSGFCNFIYSNGSADPVRDRFFHLLSRYKRVDSPGRHLNNMPNQFGDRYAHDWRTSKTDFQRRYKFTIAFENSSAPGYTTEKIMHAFLARTIPIYWGNPLVVRDFNPKAFVNCHDFATFDDVVRRVTELDTNDKLYLDVVNTPCFVGGQTPPHLGKETVLAFFKGIFPRSGLDAFRRPRYGTTKTYEQNMRLLARELNRPTPLKNLGRKMVRSLATLLPERNNA